MLGLGAQLERDSLGELLGDGVLDVPRLVLTLAVGDGVILLALGIGDGVKGEGELSVLKLLTDHLLLIAKITGIDRKFDDLLTIGQIADAERGSEHFTGVERAVVEDVGVDADHFLDIDEPGLSLFPFQKRKSKERDVSVTDFEYRNKCSCCVLCTLTVALG